MNELLTSLPPLTLLLVGLAAGALLIGGPAALVVWLRGSGRAQSQQVQIAELGAQLDAREQQIAQTTEQHRDLSERLEQSQLKLNEANTTIARLQAEQAKTVEAMNARIEELKAAREEFRKDFEALANRIFQEKSDRFSKQSNDALTALLNPMREQIGEFRKQVTEVYGNEARERAVLKSEIDRLAKLNERIGEDALNLTRALKGETKTQGNWGEMILERVLEASGLQPGREYETQIKVSGDATHRLIADAIVRLPGERDIVVDSKVSLVAYERFVGAEDDAARERELKAHVQSLRAHVKGLGNKAYHDAPGVRSLDFTVLFIPNEPAFTEALRADPTLYREALDAGVGLASPTTLLAILRVAENLWRTDRQNRNAQAIAERAGALYDKFVGFAEDIDKIGTHLDRAQSSWRDARGKLIEGRGNLARQAEMLKDLGAKTAKSLPAGLEPDALDDPSVGDD
ncbi:DNA recombination protein RmuC [uncultured Abyssibacter sp.]|uniref:DNA recombination protein RmuC n=1 Tax=uncultured Abyssibacter sp. TaxID=2320202 RepID=UPI0032B1EBC6